MPKRLSGRWEQVTTEENCYQAVCEVLQNRHLPSIGSKLHTPNRKDIEKIIIKRAKHPPREGYLYYCQTHKKEIARQVQKDLITWGWKPKPYRTKVIMDKLRKKKRRLKMPCIYDQFIHHAVLRVMIPDLQKRFYYYSCGSVPEAGQRRATEAAKKWMSKTGKSAPKYGASADVYHFYDNCSAETVMKCLRRIYKDEKLLAINKIILDSMGGCLAIGFFPSPWYANIVLDMLVDKPLKDKFGKDIKYVRFADDMLMLSRNKRKLHKAIQFIQDQLKTCDMRLKGNYTVYKVKRGAAFLSYRFFPHCTLIRKQVLYRITRTAKKVKGGISPDLARHLCSYKGIMLPANSRSVWERYFHKNTWRKCRRVISYVDKFCEQTRKNFGYAAA